MEEKAVEVLSSKAKIILKSWSLNTEHGSGMHIKHFLRASTDVLFLMSTLSALWYDAAACLGPSEVEAGRHPAASINWDLMGSINLLPLFLALSYFSRTTGER